MKKIILLSAAFLILSMGALFLKDNPDDDLGVIYSKALDSFITLDEGLNGDMKYIAIDMSTLEGINEKDKEFILKYFEKYKVDVMDASLEDLKEKGLYDTETLSIDGILLKVEDFKQGFNKVTIEGSKFRSGLGAIGVETVLKQKNGAWEVDSAEIKWIS